jgi:hypothetical protein
MSLLRGMTLDERVHRMQVNAKTKEVCDISLMIIQNIIIRCIVYFRKRFEI